MTSRGCNSKALSRRHANDLEQARCAWLLACDLAAVAVGADVRLVLQTRGAPGRGGDVRTSRARKIACYLAQVVANASTTRLAEASGMDRSTITQHGGWVEDRREADPAFDRLVADLEDALVSMAVRVVLAHLTARGDLPAGLAA